MFALVDANSFYCSAEQVFRPDWRGKPIVVLSNNDGCIVAANRQAKDAGIQQFGPYFKQLALCEKRGVLALSSNYELYADLSAKMMNVIARFAPEQYVYLIDESFLSFEQSPCIADLQEQGRLIRHTVWRECRLPVSVGFGPTLTLAKVANHAAKKLAGHQGVCLIDTERQRQQVLQALSTRDVWGIGAKLAKHLAAINITSAWQLANMSPVRAAERFSIEVARTIRELNGEACKHWRDGGLGKQQIFSTRSVGQRICDFTSLQQALRKHAAIVAAKLRKQRSCCVSLIVFANNSPFDIRPQSYRVMHRFAVPTDDTQAIARVVSRAAQQLFRDGVQYYKIGVGAIELVDSKHLQLDLLDDAPGNPPLMDVLDTINARFGRDSLFVAGQGINQSWRMRRERLTPQYTTRWRDIPRVSCS